MTKFRAGVLSGKEVVELYNYANEKQFAIPAVNIIGTSSINGVMVAAKEVNSPVIVQLSNGGAHFYAGKGLSNDGQQAAIAGCVSAALHVHTLAEAYGITVVLHTDHAAKKLLPWIDGLVSEGEKYFEKTGSPLFSSHMLHLSVESVEDNIDACVR